MFGQPQESVSRIIGVEPSEEFARIKALPVRDWRADMQRDELALRMTHFYRSLHGKQVLKPVQAATLAELHDLRGALGVIPAGEGKTLVSFLAPTVVRAERPMLLIPAALREKTLRDFKLLSQHWISLMPAAVVEDWEQYKPYPQRYVIESYDKLSSKVNGDKILETYRPDFIVMDEAHHLKNEQAACTIRFIRYMRSEPNTMCLPMSGTIMVRSALNFWHLAYFALRHHMPLPRARAEMERWAEAIDEKKNASPFRRHPGALFELADEELKDEVRKMYMYSGNNLAVLNSPEAISIARRGVQKRLDSAPGVIISKENSVEASLRITRLDWLPSVPVREMLKKLRDTGETPNEDVLLDRVAIWRQARELGCGFFYRWEPAAPKEWLKRRKRWFQIARQWTRRGLPGLDSLGQVEDAVQRGDINDAGSLEAYSEWLQIRDTFEINVVDQWVDDTTLKLTLAWMKKHPRSIVWTEHRAFGFMLSHLSGVGYCANGGYDQRGVFIDDYQGQQVIASVDSNLEGRNLQAWNKNLIVSMPPNGGWWEQLLARTHRPGQLEDTVYCDWAATCAEQDEGFQAALRDARCIEETTGVKQRLNYADHV